jgi:hypothetical protein
MEALGSSEMSVATQQTTLRHIPEDDTLDVFCLADSFQKENSVCHAETISQKGDNRFLHLEPVPEL